MKRKHPLTYGFNHMSNVYLQNKGYNREKIGGHTFKCTPSPTTHDMIRKSLKINSWWQGKEELKKKEKIKRNSQ